ncbi:hypothetical protein [Paenibacillus cisolokensis]|uniref:hypothetical protein n=1 Tax=Paenibacillus cisolokensis TaxID=1658519 RepID=UPI001BCB8524|nr:hypothetical protein [Paenibacillus cisolokensis]
MNPSRFQQPELSDVRVELTRLSDRKTWVFDEKTRKETSSSSRSAADGLYFNVDTARYGYTYGIIFRPDETQLIEDGERFAVRITGLKKRTERTRRSRTKPGSSASSRSRKDSLPDCFPKRPSCPSRSGAS